MNRIFILVFLISHFVFPSCADKSEIPLVEYDYSVLKENLGRDLTEEEKEILRKVDQMSSVGPYIVNQEAFIDSIENREEKIDHRLKMYSVLAQYVKTNFPYVRLDFSNNVPNVLACNISQIDSVDKAYYERQISGIDTVDVDPEQKKIFLRSAKATYRERPSYVTDIKGARGLFSEEVSHTVQPDDQKIIMPNDSCAYVKNGRQIIGYKGRITGNISFAFKRIKGEWEPVLLESRNPKYKTSTSFDKVLESFEEAWAVYYIRLSELERSFVKAYTERDEELMKRLKSELIELNSQL